MSCSGLHCAGCAGGAGVPPIAFVYAYGAAWVAEHLAEVAVVSAVSGVLAVAAVVALMRWCDRRQARRAAEHPIWTVRAEPAIMAATVTPQVTRGTSAPAIEQHIHFHFDPDDREAARIIRQAIPGPAGDAATREE
jgi:hypothetical protein